jgi:hypothetical protein
MNTIVARTKNGPGVILHQKNQAGVGVCFSVRVNPRPGIDPMEPEKEKSRSEKS